jgi:DNA primase small subunit
MCKRCWRFITVAVKVLDEILRGRPSSLLSFLCASPPAQAATDHALLIADFGFQHILWVYSGRRGIHAWVSDSSALALTDEQRSAIVRYIDIVRDSAKMDKKIQLSRPLHPALK